MSEDVKVGSEWTWDGTDECYPANSPMTVSSAEGEWVHYTYKSTGARKCRRHGEFLLHARRLPREAPTIEERRAALKVGEVITDPALLTVGMRVYTGVRPSGFDRVVARMSKQVVTFADGGQFGYDSIQRGRQAWERIAFLGWAQEEKAGEVEAKPPAGKPDPTPMGLSGCPVMLPVGGQCVRPADGHMVHVSGPQQGGSPQPAPPPRGLPFVYVDGCLETHTGVLCLNCESIIGKAMEAQSRYAERPDWKPKPQRPEPHRPSDTGMGGACGPVMGRLR